MELETALNQQFNNIYFIRIVVLYFQFYTTPHKIFVIFCFVIEGV